MISVKDQIERIYENWKRTGVGGVVWRKKDIARLVRFVRQNY